jgi:hypothetical protein
MLCSAGKQVSPLRRQSTPPPVEMTGLELAKERALPVEMTEF